MSDIPRSALVLALLGLVPFVWGAATLFSPGLSDIGLRIFGPRFVGPFVQLQYGTIILAFMSGVLWGFATRADARHAPAAYALSTIPALWAFFFVGAGPSSSAISLISGFIAHLGLDWFFASKGLTPVWWMRLRIPLTTVVVLCLLTTI